MIVVGVSTIMCIYSIHDVWSYWNGNPIIMDRSSEFRPIFKIPFPAVSICPISVFAPNKFNYTTTYRLLSNLNDNKSRNLTATEWVPIYSQF